MCVYDIMWKLVKEIKNNENYKGKDFINVALIWKTVNKNKTHKPQTH